jgi:hypothetical protein
MTPAGRKLGLAVHVTSSVGWLGAVVASLALAVAGVASGDAGTVRGAYIAMEVIGSFVLAPLALASLVTGLVQALGTHWGLLRHYWVVIKLIATVVATLVLLMYLQTLQSLADEARSGAALSTLDGAQRASPVLHAIGALLLLLFTVSLAIYKPRGLTRYGQRKERQRRAAASAGSGAA